MTKDEIRTLIKQQRNSIPAGEWENQSKLVQLRLLQTEAYIKCKNLLIFISFQSEIDTKEIIHQALRDGKIVYVPRVNQKDMEFYKIQSMDGLIISNYGIPEPADQEENSFILKNNNYSKQKMMDNPVQSYENLMILPGLAFDRSGSRIGYGAGYYDRYLSLHSDIPFYKIAIAFDLQVIEDIPVDQYDRKADAILTPTQYMECR